MTAIDDTLQRLATARGVEAVGLFDGAGSCVGHDGRADLTDLMKRAIERVATTAGTRNARNGNDNGLAEEDVRASLAAEIDPSQLAVRNVRGSMLAVIVSPGSDLTSSGVGFHIEVAARLIGIRSMPPRALPA